MQELLFLCPNQGGGLSSAGWGGFWSRVSQCGKQLPVLFACMGRILMILTLSNLCFQQTEMMTEFIQSCQVLNSPELQVLALALVRNTVPRLAVQPQGSQQGALMEMAVHMAAVLLCGHSPVLQPLRNLACQPQSMQVRTQSSGALQHIPAACLCVLDPWLNLSQQQCSTSLFEL